MLARLLDIVCIALAVGFGLTIVAWLAVGIPYAVLTRRRSRDDAESRRQFERFLRYLPWFHALAGSTLVLFFAALALRGWLE